MAKTHYDSSALMSAYNYARAWTRAIGAPDDKRVNSAFGYLQSGRAAEKWEEYGTTAMSCGCPDYRIRQLACKHLLSRMIHIKYQQIVGDVSQFETDVKCWTCDEIIEDLTEAEIYGEEIRHIECPEPTWAEERPLEMPNYGALLVMAARALRPPE